MARLKKCPKKGCNERFRLKRRWQQHMRRVHNVGDTW